MNLACLSALRALLLSMALWSGLVRAGGLPPDPTISFSELPLDIAVTQVHGSGRRVIAIFADPNCSYCKELDRELADMTDVTIHTFIYPILSADSREKARTIWCSADRAKAWTDWMTTDKPPRAPKCDAKAIDAVLALGRKLKVRATPTVFLADGERITGLPEKMDLEIAISSPKVLSSQRK